MDICEEDKSNDDTQEPSLEDKFSKLFCELEHCPESEQKVKIEEMNEIIEEMSEREFKSVFTTRMFDKIYKMIEEKKMTMENAILLMNHAGYCKVLKNFWNPFFEKSSLSRRFEQMIFEEEKKKERKNEKLFVDLCECFVFLNGCINSKMLCVCVPYLLKVALHKEESEETQKEVEMALLTLNGVGYCEVKQKVYLKEITEIIKHQQKHRNLTKLAYQYAWQFLIKRFIEDRNLEDTVVNELHFGREAARELEELSRNMDWKKKKEEMSKEEAKEEFALMRWLETLKIYFFCCQLHNEEFIGLFCRIVQIYRAAKDNCRDISNLCMYPLRYAAKNRFVKVEVLLKGGAIDVFLEEMQRPKLNYNIAYECFQFFMNVSNRLKEKTDNKMEEVKRKATKRKVFEKLEEEGYEDTITSFYETLKILNARPYRTLSLKISDYFVNV